MSLMLLTKRYGIKMPKKNFFAKGQNLIEIVVIFAILSLVVVGMQTYVKRGIQGKTKDLTDIIIGSEQRVYIAETEKSTSNIIYDTTMNIETKAGGTIYKDISGRATVNASSESTYK